MPLEMLGAYIYIKAHVHVNVHHRRNPSTCVPLVIMYNYDFAIQISYFLEMPLAVFYIEPGICACMEIERKREREKEKEKEKEREYIHSLSLSRHTLSLAFVCIISVTEQHRCVEEDTFVCVEEDTCVYTHLHVLVE